MSRLALLIRPGTDLTNAAVQLRALAEELRNPLGVRGMEKLTFVSRVMNTEKKLRELFPDRVVWEGLRTETFWRIWESRYSVVDLDELITDEAGLQATWLDELAERLEALAKRLTAAPGKVTVLDTNSLLHYLPPDQVKWREVIGESTVRLVIPLRVIEELDEKKYTARDDLAGRARGLLSRLRRQLVETAYGPVPLDESGAVTIEVFVDEDPRRRTQDADEEVLETCETLQLGEQSLVLVTGDTGLTIRARARCIETVEMPEGYLRRPLQREATAEA